VADDRDPLREAAARVQAADPDAAALAARTDPGDLDLEAIIIQHGRPVLAVENDDVAGDAGTIWKPRLDAPGVRDALQRVIPSVGRIEVDNHPYSPYVGTGWLIADDVVVTAGFVAEEFAAAGGQGYVFRPAAPNRLNLMVARVDFKREAVLGNPRPFAVREVLDIGGEGKDSIAFLRLEPFGPYGPLSTPLRLSARPPAAGRHVAVIGYPAADSRMDQALMRSVFGDVFEVKRVALGQILGVEGTTVRHDCSTTGGTAGAPIIDLQTGEVVGMHHGGVQFGDKFGVTAAVIAARIESLRQAASRPAAQVSAGPAVAPALPAAPPHADELVSALHGAFGFDELVRLAAGDLKVDLNALSPKGSTGEAVAALVGWAKTEGRIPELFAAASARRPNNPRLAAGPVVRPGASHKPHELRLQLRGVLLDQFPKRIDLAILLDDALGADLDRVAAQADGMEAVYFAVVRWLWIDPVERLRPVVELAAERRPANIDLQALLAEIAQASQPAN
jgi:hypothetical protein